MWIEPKPLNGIQPFWETLKENRFFVLEKNLILGFRILLKRIPAYPDNLIVAISKAEDAIRKDWLWIEGNLLADPPQEADEDVTDFLSFLELKFASLVKNQKSQEEEEWSKIESHIQQLFKLSSDEKLVQEFTCRLSGYFGTMYVFESCCCFRSRLPQEVLIFLPFRDITVLKKDSSPIGFIIKAVFIKTAREEFSFSAFSDRDQVFSLLEQLWKLAMDRLLEHTEQAKERLELIRTSTDKILHEELYNITKLKRTTSTSSLPPKFFLQVSKNGRKSPTIETLQHDKKNSNFRALFKLPAEEVLVEDFPNTTLTSGALIVKGTLYISQHFVEFCSKQEDTTITVVIPFKHVFNVSKGKMPINLKQDLLIINIELYQFMFALQNLESAFTKTVKLWKVSQKSVNEEQQDNLLKFIQSAGKELLLWTARQPNQEDEEVDIKAQHKQTWEQYCKLYGNPGISMIVDSKRLKHLLHTTYGLHQKMKGMQWHVFSGAINKWIVKPEYYQQLSLSFADQSSLSVEDIDKDLHRSFPHNYKEQADLETLRRVLIAYSWRNPSIGYCQSMNIVCAQFLLLMSEEAAFWLLCALCEDYVPEYYSKSLLGPVVDQQIFEELAKEHIPSIAEHFAEIELAIGAITCPWFMCLFIGHFPFEVHDDRCWCNFLQSSCTILDLFFLEGRCILFQVAMAVFKFTENIIMEESSNLQSLFTRIEEACYKHHQEILKIAFEEFSKIITVDVVNEKSDSRKLMAIKEMVKQNVKSQLRDLSMTTELTKTELEEVHQEFSSVLPSNTTDEILDSASFFKFASKNWISSRLSLEGREKIWQRYSKDGKMEFSTVASWLSIIQKGTLNERFEFCLRLYDDFNTEIFTPRQVLKALHNLAKLYRKEEVGQTLDQFVMMMFHKVISESADTDSLVYQRIQRSFHTSNENDMEVMEIDNTLNEFNEFEEASEVSLDLKTLVNELITKPFLAEYLQLTPAQSISPKKNTKHQLFHHSL